MANPPKTASKGRSRPKDRIESKPNTTISVFRGSASAKCDEYSWQDRLGDRVCKLQNVHEGL